MIRRLGLLVAIVATASCGSRGVTGVDESGRVCTAQAVAAIDVRALEAILGAPVTFRDLWARARDGAYMDSSFVSFTSATAGAVHFRLAYERPGTYTVTVKASGYQAWTKNNVVVTSNGCHVNQVVLTAYLQR